MREDTKVLCPESVSDLEFDLFYFNMSQKGPLPPSAPGTVSAIWKRAGEGQAWGCACCTILNSRERSSPKSGRAHGTALYLSVLPAAEDEGLKTTAGPHTGYGSRSPRV